MKFNKILVIVTLIAVILIVFLLSFSIFRKPKITESGNLTFEELCKQNSDQWMGMEETRTGKPISTTMCFGCMIADNHFCSSDEYISYIKSLPSFVR